MTKLPTKQFQQLVPKLREKGFYEEQEQRPISWSAYTLTQIEDAKATLIFIRDAVDSCHSLDLAGQVGRPLTNPKDLAKAVLFCEALGIPERQAQGWLELLGPFLGVYDSLDDWVIGEAYNRPEVAYILKQVFDQSKTSDKILSGDGTRLETSRKQNYELNKQGGDRLTSIIDSREIVQAFDLNGKQECQAMHLLIEQVDGESLRLDAGFVDRILTQKIAKLGMTPFIFPKKSIILNGSLAWKIMYLSLLYDIQAWLEEYHQRSHTESFHSSFKRVFGIITKRRPTAKLVQVMARIILHNRRRQAYFAKLA